MVVQLHHPATIQPRLSRAFYQPAVALPKYPGFPITILAPLTIAMSAEDERKTPDPELEHDAQVEEERNEAELNDDDAKDEVHDTKTDGEKMKDEQDDPDDDDDEEDPDKKDDPPSPPPKTPPPNTPFYSLLAAHSMYTNDQSWEMPAVIMRGTSRLHAQQRAGGQDPKFAPTSSMTRGTNLRRISGWDI